MKHILSYDCYVFKLYLPKAICYILTNTYYSILICCISIILILLIDFLLTPSSYE